MSETSWQAKAKYNAKTYKVLQVQLKKELVARFEEKLAADGKSKAQFVREAIEQYLEDVPPE